MPLGNIDALHAWAERENPSYLTWRLVESWVLGLATAPWQAPSVPLTPNTGEPWEIRMAEIPDSGSVEVFYEHEHETGLVNILHIERRAMGSGM